MIYEIRLSLTSFFYCLFVCLFVCLFICQHFLYVSESCLVKLLMSVSDLSGTKMPQARLHILLDLMWTVMDPQEVENTFENILISLLTAYRYVSFYHCCRLGLIYSRVYCLVFPRGF